MRSFLLFALAVLSACAAEGRSATGPHAAIGAAGASAFDGRYPGRRMTARARCAPDRDVVAVVTNGQLTIEIGGGSRIIGSVAADGSIHDARLRGANVAGTSRGSGAIRDGTLTLAMLNLGPGA